MSSGNMKPATLNFQRRAAQRRATEMVDCYWLMVGGAERLQMRSLTAGTCD